jgi:hypothetical protein
MAYLLILGNILTDLTLDSNPQRVQNGHVKGKNVQRRVTLTEETEFIIMDLARIHGWTVNREIATLVEEALKRRGIVNKGKDPEKR